MFPMMLARGSQNVWNLQIHKFMMKRYLFFSLCFFYAIEIGQSVSLPIVWLVAEGQKSKEILLILSMNTILFQDFIIQQTFLQFWPLGWHGGPSQALPRLATCYCLPWDCWPCADRQGRNSKSGSTSRGSTKSVKAWH